MITNISQKELIKRASEQVNSLQAERAFRGTGLHPKNDPRVHREIADTMYMLGLKLDEVACVIKSHQAEMAALAPTQLLLGSLINQLQSEFDIAIRQGN